jgi:hypothetical protein
MVRLGTDMRQITPVIDLDLTQPLADSVHLDRFTEVDVLCRLRERPLGFVRASVTNGRLAFDQVVQRLVETLIPSCAVALAERAIAAGRPPRWPDSATLIESAISPNRTGPLVTVAVVSGGRPDLLRSCLDAVMRLEYDSLDVLVVEGAPASDAVERLVRDSYPTVRYVRELRPGTNAMRNRAILECRGELLAFTTDEAVVDAYWVSSLVRVFLADPEVVAVAGMVLPRELDPDGDCLSAVGDCARDFNRRWYRAPVGLALREAGDSACAGGINLAFWRDALDDLRDPARDDASPAMNTLVYEPSAIVRHSRSGAARPAASAGWSVSSFGVTSRLEPEAQRHVDLADHLRPITDATGHERLNLVVSWQGRTIGRVRLAHHGAVVSPLWLGDEIAQQLALSVLDARMQLGEAAVVSAVGAGVARALLPVVDRFRRGARAGNDPTSETPRGSDSRPVSKAA